MDSLIGVKKNILILRFVDVQYSGGDHLKATDCTKAIIAAYTWRKCKTAIQIINLRYGNTNNIVFPCRGYEYEDNHMFWRYEYVGSRSAYRHKARF